MPNRRYPIRPRKDLRWSYEAVVGEASNLNIAVATLFDPLTNFGSGLERRTVNLKRLIFDLLIHIRADDLEDLASVWGVSAWALMMVDRDDATAYNPDAPIDILPETVIRNGYAERIGWGIIPIVVAQTVQGNSSAFSGHTRVQFDVQSNRRISTDQVLKLYYTRTAEANIDINTTVPFRFLTTLRTLYQVP